MIYFFFFFPLEDATYWTFLEKQNISEKSASRGTLRNDNTFLPIHSPSKNCCLSSVNLDGIAEVSTELPDHTVQILTYKLSNTDTLKLHKESDSALVDFSTQVTHTCLTAQAKS